MGYDAHQLVGQLLVRSPDVGATLEEAVLAPLHRYAARRSANLLETLEVFVDSDLDRRRAAERLEIHPNTIDYRLRRIEELTGLDLDRPWDLTAICLALWRVSHHNHGGNLPGIAQSSIRARPVRGRE
jgi:DNA-binding PucR family transcriptional regulator